MEQTSKNPVDCKIAPTKLNCPTAAGLGPPIGVLLVADNPESAFLTRAHLTERGEVEFHVEWSKNLGEAMNRLAGPGIDVVLFDLGMPELSGYMSRRTITSVAGNTFPIVILTSDEQAISLDLTLAFGATNYLLKNWASPAEIKRALREAVSDYRAEFMRAIPSTYSGRKGTVPKRDPSGMHPQLVAPKILVVDDQRESLALFEVALSEVDAELVLVTSGSEALRKLEKDVFAMVLLDVCMPEMDGFEVAHRIRASERSRGGCVPVILVTGMAGDEESLERSYSSGAIDYLSKPVKPEILKQKFEVFRTMFNERKAWEAANTRHLALQFDFTVKMAIAEKTMGDLALQNADLEYRYQLGRNQALDPWVEYESGEKSATEV